MKIHPDGFGMSWAISPSGLTSATEAPLNGRDTILLAADCQVFVRNYGQFSMIVRSLIST